MHFCWKGMRLPCRISWDLQNSIFMQISFRHFPPWCPIVLIQSAVGTDIHRHGTLDRLGFSENGCFSALWKLVVKLYTVHPIPLGQWSVYSPSIPSQVRAGTMSDFAVHLSSSISSASSDSLLRVNWDRADILVVKILHWLTPPWIDSGWVVTLHLGSDTSLTSVTCCLGQLP